MRRFFCAAAVLALAATCPLAGWAGDREIAEQIISRLKVQRDAGTLKGFKLDLKVEEGVVLLKGKVSDADQKTAVLAAAQGLDGIAQVVDQIAVEDAPVAAPAATPKVVENKSEGFSFREALQREASKTRPMPVPAAEFEGAYTAAEQAPATVAPASANERADSDDAVTASVISALGRAQKDGHLRGFGVDVTTEAGKVVLNGRASTAAHKALIVDLARNTRGVTGVVDNIAVFSPQPLKTGNARPLQDPRAQRTGAVQPAAHPVMAAAPNAPAAAPMPTQLAANYGMAGGVQGQPMPMAPYAGGQAAPRYDQPYLPNYAWPGYAAYPNYAALSYPQQYSPSAWPYIGPFYPYPQVPLGWRKVSLEWDDGWWFLDFTDRNGRH